MLAPVGFEHIEVACVRLKRQGVTLFGFLLYTASDLAVVEYIKHGETELDVLSGQGCTVFLIDSPSPAWINYSRLKNHLWWRIIGKDLPEKLIPKSAPPPPIIKRTWSLLHLTIIKGNKDTSIVIGDANITGHNNVMPLMGIINPSMSLPYNCEEALNVAKKFGVSFSELPCLIFFKDLYERVLWKSPLINLRSQDDVKKFFREFFESTQFKNLIK